MFGFVKLYHIDTCQLTAHAITDMSEFNHRRRGAESFVKAGESPVGWMRRSRAVSHQVERWPTVNQETAVLC